MRGLQILIVVFIGIVAAGTVCAQDHAADDTVDLDAFDFSTTQIEKKPNPVGFDTSTGTMNVSTTEVANLSASGANLSASVADLSASGAGIRIISVKQGVSAKLTPPLPLTYRVRVPIYFGLLANAMRVKQPGFPADELYADDVGLPGMGILAAPEIRIVYDKRISLDLGVMMSTSLSGAKRLAQDARIGSATFPAGTSVDSELTYRIINLDARYPVYQRNLWTVHAGLSLISVYATETLSSPGLDIKTIVSTPVMLGVGGDDHYALQTQYGVINLESKLLVGIAGNILIDFELGATYRIRSHHEVGLSYRLHYLSVNGNTTNGDEDVKFNVMFNGPQLSYVYRF